MNSAIDLILEQRWHEFYEHREYVKCLKGVILTSILRSESAIILIAF